MVGETVGAHLDLPEFRAEGDPSLRLKNAFAQDDVALLLTRRNAYAMPLSDGGMASSPAPNCLLGSGPMVNSMVPPFAMSA